MNASYAYDPLGRRTKKSGVGVKAGYFLSDGADEVVDYDSQRNVLELYVPGPAIDEPIVMSFPTQNGDGTYSYTHEYFHTNHQGSVIAMSGDSGALAEGPFLYDAYGNCFKGSTACGSLANTVPYKFTGCRLDEETGLYYYRARCYSPTLGRFCQTDPVGYTADLNLYTYVQNNPLDGVDPYGKDVVYYVHGLSGYYIAGGEASAGVALDIDALRQGRISATRFYTFGLGGGGGAAEGAFGSVGAGVGYFRGSLPEFHGDFVNFTGAAEAIEGYSFSLAFPPNHMFDPQYGNFTVQKGIGSSGGSVASTYTWFGENKSLDLSPFLSAINVGLSVLSHFSSTGSRIINANIERARKNLTSAANAINQYQNTQSGVCSPLRGGCGPGQGVEVIP